MFGSYTAAITAGSVFVTPTSNVTAVSFDAAPPRPWREPRVREPAGWSLPPDRSRFEGARHGFAQAARLPCYRGARTR